MRGISELKDLKGKTVLLRADFNVPVANEAVAESYRIDKSFGTINRLRSAGASVVVISHFEGEGGSLKPVFEYIKKRVPEAAFAGGGEDWWGEAEKARAEMPQGGILLLENIRRNEGEKKNDPSFAERLSKLADIYVNDAFAVSHRAHASVVGVPKFLPSYAGLQLEEEVRRLTECFSPEHPFLFVLGGAKFDTKIPLIRRFLDLADEIYIGGALANDIMKARGLNVGRSLVSDKPADPILANDAKISIPKDVVVSAGEGKEVKSADAVLPDDVILDIGPKSSEELAEKAIKAKFILWNGPLGNFENGYKDATLSLALACAKSRGKTVVGGGDTLAAISALGVMEKFYFVSTGGGAMLDFLANGTLPGIEALNTSISN